MTSYSIGKVEVVLGLKYDGPVPEPFADAVGRVTVGPLGLLRLLESQLGLPVPDSAFTARLIQYLACVDQAQHDAAFYHESFAADPFSVARTLLQWRDQWYLAGWSGAFPDSVPPRLRDLAAIEKLALPAVDAGVGQRITRAIALLQHDPVAIACVHLRDDLEDFPHRWRELVAAIGAPLHPATEPQPQAPAETDLGKLQRQILAPDAPGATDHGDTLRLCGDGTVTVLGAHAANESTPLAASLAIRWLAESPRDSLAMLAERRGELLDEAMDAAGAPRLGFAALSPWRPIFQVLPLCCELLWEPLSPTALFQFLSHPVGPIPGRVRERLARTVADVPGIGSDRWYSALNHCLDEEERLHGPQGRERLRQQLQFWLTPDRCRPREGVSAQVLRERAQQVAGWLAGMRETAGDETMRALYFVALNQVQEFELAVERLHRHGRDVLTRDNVLRLIDDVRGTGAPLADRRAEVAPGSALALRAEHAGALNAPVDRLIWWDCQAGDQVLRWPWSRAERAALEEHGVRLQSEDAQLQWLGKAWLRPLLCARKQFTVVLHDDAERHHPLWEQISALAPGLPILPANEAATAARLALSLTDLMPHPLPGKRRWWQIGDTVRLERREFESFSSLDTFINSPYQWVLNHAARLRPGSLSAVTDGNRLKGNIAHRLFEQFFGAHPGIAAMSMTGIQDTVDAWVDAHALPLLRQEGAVLLEPGRQAECERLIAQLRDALTALVVHLHQAGVQTVQMELEQRGDFTGGKLQGAIDLLATNRDGHEAIIDIKWGGGTHRRNAMRTGSYLQLATYAELRRAGQQNITPSLGYFIISDSTMLGLGDEFFPQAERIDPKSGESLPEFWARFENTWKWRREQLDRGLVEVTITNTVPTKHSQPDGACEHQGLEIPEASDGFNDYAVLTGWEPNA